MKTFRDSFEENYMAYEEPCKNKRGFRIRYEYVGDWYAYLPEQGKGQRCKYTLCGLCLLGTVFFLLGALRKCELNYGSFPVLFSGLSLAAMLFEWYGVVRFAVSRDRLTEHSFKEINGMLRIAPWLAGLLSIGAALSCVYTMISGGLSISLITVPVCYLLSGICSGLTAFFYRAMPYEKQRNPACKDSSKKFIHM